MGTIFLLIGFSDEADLLKEKQNSGCLVALLIIIAPTILLSLAVL
jgi:hypothetical protein